MDGEIIDGIIATIEGIGFIITIIKFIRKWKKLSIFIGLVVFAIVMGGLWYWGYSTNVLLGFAMGMVCCVGGIMLVTTIYRNKQLTEQLKQKDREYQIYKKIVEKGEQRLFKKTQKISKEWIEQWDEGVRQWERNALRIEKTGAGIKALGNRPSLVKGMCVQGQEEVYSLYEKELKNICAQGGRELRLLYEKALEEELAEEHYKKINNSVKHCIDINHFKENYQKTLELMNENGIIVEEIVEPHTQEIKYKATMLFFHWYLYVLDNMIANWDRRQSEEQSSEKNEKRESTDSYKGNISTIIACEEIQKTISPHRSEGDWVLDNKSYILSLLYGISYGYKVAITTFIYYKMLINTVKEGYIALDEDCSYSTVEDAMKACRKKDKEEKKDLSISGEIPTFEEAYKLGAKERLRLSNEKCFDQLFYWDMLLKTENARDKLQYIFDEDQLKKLEEAINKEKELFSIKLREAIVENKDFHYNQSCVHFINYLK
ncbi:hypothetical protein [Bartonella sp. AU55XJBT]|uniref:hypothetical protein n=1 Tax=Bartonella sp. AU55XJBT TaxID=3019091 RepID=UPI00235ECCEC|nr:hypothetical protein [Bartonella sp. AU55XJBT]